MCPAFVRSEIECTSVDPFSERFVLAQRISDVSAWCYGPDSPFVTIVMAPLVLEEERRVTEVFDWKTCLDDEHL
jgi:hypothetical protein